MHRLTFLFAACVVSSIVAGGLLAQTGLPVIPPDKALVKVRVPADATVIIDGKVTSQTGVERVYITPSLQPGFAYYLEIVARWDSRGQPETAKRVVEFQAGQSKIVDLAQVSNARDNPQPAPPKAKARSFQFTYGGRVTELKPGASARIWIPMAVSNGQQEVSVVSQQIPRDFQVTKDTSYGNTILYFEGTADAKGEIPFEVTYKALRKEVKTGIKGNLYLQPAPGEKVERYLQPDVKVPVAGKPLDLLKENLKDKELPANQFAAAKVLYDVVNKHMEYKKVGTGWGQGDALWACDSKYGNCTDFHSLFISMARGNKIASKFEMGFPLPVKAGAGAVPGYHCWAWFLPESKGWIPVDISEANQHPELTDYYFGNLSENRLSFSVGRDIDLEPRQKGPPLNFFIYPYVEVEGKVYPAEKVQRAFAYKDVP